MSHLSLELLPADRGFIPVALTADGGVDPAVPAPSADGRDTWCVIACRGTRLHPGFADIVGEAGRQRPDVDVFYGDEVDAFARRQAGRVDPETRPGCRTSGC